MKRLLALTFLTFFALSSLAGGKWSEGFSFDGSVIDEEAVITLLPTDELSTTALAEMDKADYISMTVVGTSDTNVWATLYENSSPDGSETTINWDYTKEEYEAFKGDQTYLLFKNIVTTETEVRIGRLVEILPEPGFVFLFVLGGLALLRGRAKALLIALLAFAVAESYAEGTVTKVACQQDWPFSGKVVIKYTVASESEDPRFDVKFLGSVDDGYTVFDLTEKGTLSKDGANGTLKGTGDFVTVWTPNETMGEVKVNNMIVKVEVEEKEKKPMRTAVDCMDPEGYLGELINKNIDLWQVKAYGRNPNIVEAIAKANGVLTFDTLLGRDWYGVDEYYDINIKALNQTNALCYTMKKTGLPSGSFDRDMVYGNDPKADTDWTDATDLIVSIDAHGIPHDFRLRVAFEEQVVGRESFDLKNGASVTYYAMVDGALTSVVAHADSSGYVTLPGGFLGYLALPLNTDTFKRYWSEGANNQLDLGKVGQFQLSLRTSDSDINKSFYITRFLVAGPSFAETTPAGLPYATVKSVWTFEGLWPRSGDSGNIVKWYGEFVGKLLTGMAFNYRIFQKEELKQAAFSIINSLAEAQGEDGYLGVFQGGNRWSLNSDNWDLWDHYHAIMGLLEWYKMTGNETAFNVAKKAIDLIYETFHERSYLVRGGFETNRGIAHGYVLMYQVTKDRKYLDEAERIIQQDCQEDNGWYEAAKNGRDYYTTDCTRWEVLHMIMALGGLYEETKNPEYLLVMKNVYESILRTDIHNTGGFTTNEGAQGDPYINGVIETCCTIAWTAYATEYFRYAPSASIIDEIERSYFNGVLGALLDDFTFCTYNTPMNTAGGMNGYDGKRVPSQRDIAFQYNAGSPDMNCCQANIARGLGQVAEWAVTCDDDRLYLNYYGQSFIRSSFNGNEVILKQLTDYPSDGRVHLSVTYEAEGLLPLSLRVPKWAEGSTIVVNGGAPQSLTPGTYFDLEVSNGDEAIIEFGMPWTFERGKKDQAGYVSVFRGPILFAIEGEDRTKELAYADVVEAQKKERTDKKIHINYDIEIEGGTVHLVDFASAGKYNGATTPMTYRSWLKVSGVPTSLSASEPKAE